MGSYVLRLLSRLVQSSRVRSSATVVMLAVVSVCCAGVFTSTASAQSGTTQVSIIGFPPILPSPLVYDLVDNYESGRYLFTVTYASASATPTRFRLRVSLTHNGQSVGELTSLPADLSPGVYSFSRLIESPGFVFEASVSELVDILVDGLDPTIRQSGSLPEGLYVFSAELLPEDPFSNIVSVAGNATFAVRIAQPPVLFTPTDRAFVNQEYPVFSWTPVNLPDPSLVEYEFILVPMKDYELPKDVIESRRALLEETLQGQTTLIYGPQYLPLTEGIQYAWQVRAVDRLTNVPIRDDGFSEIRTFTYGASERRESLANLKQITLEPGFAVLTNLDRVDAESAPSSYRLNGGATLTIQAEPAFSIPVTLENLEIQNVNLQDPVLLGGSVRSLRRAFNLGETQIPDLAQITGLRWAFGDGFALDGSIQLPDGRRMPAQGNVRYSAAGLYGEMFVDSEALVEAQDDRVKVSVDRIAVRLPGGELTGGGSLTLFGGAACEFSHVRFVDEALSIPIACSNASDVTVAGNDEEVTLSLERIDGSVAFDEAGLTYQLSTHANLNFAEDASSKTIGFPDVCGLQTSLRLTNGEPIATDRWFSSCTSPKPELDLGFFRARLMGSSVETFDYTDGQWDVTLASDMELVSPYLDNQPLPVIPNVVIDKAGIQFPEARFGREELDVVVAMDLLRFALRQIEIPSFTFLWFDWDKLGQGPWNFSFSGGLRVPDDPTQPDCIRGSELSVAGAYAEPEGMAGAVVLDQARTCRVPLGPSGTAIVFENLEGKFGGLLEFDPNAAEKYELGAVFTGDGRIEYGKPFVCQRSNDDVGRFSFSPSGKEINLKVENFVPSCPLSIGPLSATVTRSTLDLFGMRRQQFGTLAGTARIALDRSNFSEGSFELDLVTGEFTGLNFSLESAFSFGLPAEEPIFEFTVDRARLDKDGLVVSGDQIMRLGRSESSVRFNRTRIDVNNGKIFGGDIRFTEGFALTAGVDASTRELKFGTSARGVNPPTDPGFALNLDATGILDSTGFRYSGDVEGELFFDGDQFDSDLRVSLSHDFALGTTPPGIKNGQADFYVNDTRIAFADASGLHPATTDIVTALLPDVMPLPVQSVAYLRLKDGNTDLVTFADQGNGLIRINSVGAGPVLVVPAFDRANPPEFANVQLTDVLVRVAGDGYAYQSGSIRVQSGADTPDDWPIVVDAVTYEDRESGGQGLYIDGTLRLFGTDLGDAARIALLVDDQGASGAVSLQDVHANVPLSGTSDVVRLSVSEVVGTIGVGGAYRTSLNIDSMIELADGDEVAASANLQLLWDGSSVVTTGFGVGVGGGSVDLGPLAFVFDGVETVGGLAYSRAAGWMFDIELDAQVLVQLEGGREFAVPLLNVAVTQNGLILPAQEIHDGTIPGLNLPPFDLAGISLKPLALRSNAPVVVDWYSGQLDQVDVSGFSPSFDFALRVPSLSAAGLLPSDGLTVYQASIVDGLISAVIDPFTPAVARELVVLPSSERSPLLSVSEVGGSLGVSTQRTQLISIDLLASLTRLGALDDEVACSPSAPFRLQMIDGLYFQGSIQTYQPCGNLKLGPARLSFGPSEVAFAFTPDTESIVLNGNATVRLPGPSENSEVSVSGAIGVDVLAGALTSGSIVLDESFAFGVPLDSEEPLLLFEASRAVLDASGFTVSGSGALQASAANVSVQFADLLFGFPNLEVAGGTATIGSGLDFQFNLAPLGWSFVGPSSPEPSDNYLRIDLNGGAVLSSAGIGLTGNATANLVFAGNAFASMHATFNNDFALNVGRFGVNQGSAEFSVAQSDAEPLAVIDENGFRIGGGIVAALPARIGLPTEDIAYLVTRDAQGNPLIDATNSSDGWALSTNAPVSLVLAGLENAQGDAPTIDVDFQLTADATYNVLGGTVSLAAPLDLEPYLDIPVTLDALSLVSNSPLSLVAGLSIELPKALGEHELGGQIAIGPNGFEELQLELGRYATNYQQNVTPISSHTFNGPLGNTDQSLTFALQGVRATFGNAPSLAIAATASSSIFGDPNEVAMFMAGSFGNAAWSVNVTPVGLDDAIPLGVANLRPLGDAPFGLVLDDQHFELSIDGELSFEPLLGEPFDIVVQDFVIGVRDVDASPRFVFEVPSVTLPDQSFSLFEGGVSLEIESPTLGSSNGIVAVSATGGAIEFAGIAATFGRLAFDTQGTFDIEQINLGDVEIMDGLVSVASLGMGLSNGSLRLDAGFDVTLPEPVDATAEATLSIYRDAQGRVQIATEMPTFDFDNEYALGDFGTFQLTKAKVDVDPFDPASSGIFVNGVVNVADEPRVWFGNDANFPSQAGISYTDQNGLKYNISGNASFELETSFFAIDVESDVATSSSNAFEIVLGGTASVKVSGISGEVGYRGFTVNADGVADAGRLVAPAEFKLIEIMTLAVGDFQYESKSAGITLTIADGFGQSMTDVQARASQAAPTKQISVTEYMCFGSCGTQSSPVSLSIGGNANSDNAVFSGGVDKVLFYRTTSGDTQLLIDNFNMQVSEVFSMSASMQYENTSSGVTLRVVGGGEFDVGGVRAQAALAGSFSNVNNEPSFGLFVAVASNIGIPIVPGVIDLNGVGAGFFYKPRQADLNLVTGPNGALSAFGYTPIKPVPGVDDVDFAAMLFAKAGIGGSAGKYIVNASAFLQITNRSILVDARGTVLQFDGTGAIGAELSAGLSIMASTAPFMLDGNVKVDVDIPIYLSGGLDLNMFMLQKDAGLVWGIIGEGQMELFGGMFKADGSFAAADIGFLLEAGIEFDVDLKIISVNAGARGAIWLMTDEQFPMPFGVYAVVWASVCADTPIGEACAGADLRVALVKRRPSGFEMFAAIAVDLPIIPTVRAWAAVSDKGVRAGFGKGAGSDLIEEAMAQAEDFKQYIRDLASEIEAAKQEMQAQETAIENFFVNAQDVAKAGARLYTASPSERATWVQRISSNEPAAALNTPGFSFVRDSLLLGDLPGARPLESDPAWDKIYAARDEANALESSAIRVAELVTPRLQQAELEAIAFRADAEAVIDGFYNSLEQSPVVEFDQGHSGNDAQAPSFTISSTAAASIAGQSAALTTMVAESADQTLDAINTISRNLSRINSLMSLQVAITRTVDPITGRLTGASVSTEPSVGEMMQHFALAESAFDEYYAHYASWFWNGRAWAQRMQSKLQTVSGAVDASLLAAYNATSTNNARLAQSVERARIIAELSQSAAAMERVNDHPATAQNISDADLRTLYTTNGKSLWYEMHRQGLGVVAEQSGAAAVRILGEQFNRMQPLVSAHASATNTMENVYQLRADIAAMQYNLVDNLLSQDASGDFLSDSAAASLTSLKTHLAQSLQVPSISNISVSSQRRGYVNEVAIQLGMQHPIDVAEVSVQIEREGSTDTGVNLSDYRSIGKTNVIRFVDGKTGYSRDASNEAFHEEKRYAIGVRARGAAGNTAIRRAQFSVAVGPQGTSQTTTAPTETLVEDTTPPAAPVIPLNSIYGHTSEPTYWTTRSSGLKLLAYARDVESDIDKFEYAIGTTPGGTSVVGWTLLEGTRFRDNGLDGLPAVFVDAESRAFALELGQPYYVSVRATNGEGLVSPVSVAGPIVSDRTVPTDPGIAFEVMTMPLLLHSPPVVRAPINYVPGFSHGPSKTSYLASLFQSVVRPTATVKWQASTDPESGIAGYEYVVGGELADAEFNPQIMTTETQRSFTASGTPVFNENEMRATYPGSPGSYVDTVHVHVQARNRAGGRSQSVTFSAAPRDPTPPVGLDIRARVRPSAIDVFLTGALYDIESGVAGVEYSIGSAPGQTNVRAWPSDVDFVWTNVHSINQPDEVAPSFEINTKPLPVGVPIYVNVRARNTHGGLTNSVVAGPIIVDPTPPSLPAITLSKVGSDLRIAVTGMQDAESGLAKVEYKVDDRFNVLASSSWKTFVSVKSNPKTALNHTITEDVSAVTSLNNARVSIRLTNGNGAQTVATKTMLISVVPQF